ATIANFENDQNIRIIFEPEWASEAEHISLRFKTERHADSVLLSTYSKYSKDRIELALENTHIILYMKIGDSECILKSIRYSLCDNEWHTVKISREGNRVILQVDNDEPATSKTIHLFLMPEMLPQILIEIR
ncbi:neurexin-1a-like isoform X4, partial [Brachionus plicatilis]